MFTKNSMVLTAVVAAITLLAVAPANAAFYFFTANPGNMVNADGSWFNAAITAGDVVEVQAWDASANVVANIAYTPTSSVASIRPLGHGTSVTNQTAGAITCTESVMIGRNYWGGTHTWNMSGGSMTTAETYLCGSWEGNHKAYLNVSGGAWTNTGATYVGYISEGGQSEVGEFANASLAISSGSYSTDTMLLARNANTPASVVVSGGSLTVSALDGLTVGAGTASLSLTGGSITLGGNEVGFDAANAWFTQTAPTGYVYAETYNAGANSTLLHFVPVPEPGTFAMLAAGLLGLIAYAWRKRK